MPKHTNKPIIYTRTAVCWHCQNIPALNLLFFALALSLSLSLSPTHTHTHTHATIVCHWNSICNKPNTQLLQNKYRQDKNTFRIMHNKHVRHGGHFKVNEALDLRSTLTDIHSYFRGALNVQTC